MKKWRERRRLFQLKGLPAFHNSHASTVNMVLYCLTLSQMTNLSSYKLKEFAYDNFISVENDGDLS